jgi:hypothetical protein
MGVWDTWICFIAFFLCQRVCFPVVKLSIQYSLNKADGPYAIGLCWFLFMSDLHCNAQEAVLYYWINVAYICDMVVYFLRMGLVAPSFFSCILSVVCTRQTQLARLVILVTSRIWKKEMSEKQIVGYCIWAGFFFKIHTCSVRDLMGFLVRICAYTGVVFACRLAWAELKAAFHYWTGAWVRCSGLSA